MGLLLRLITLIGACIIVDISHGALAFEFAQAAVVDPERPRAYLMAPEALIEEVDLSTGQILAASARAAKPLLLFDSLLLAQAEPRDEGEKLRLVGLNAKDLSTTFEVEVPLPAGVHPLIDDRLGSSFHASARLDGGDVVVLWRSVRRRITGTPTNEPADIAAGWARIDPNTGQLTSSGHGEAPFRHDELPPIVRRLVQSGALANKPCQVDDLITGAEYREEGGATAVILRRWNSQTAEGLPDIKLFGGELTLRSLSADCRHILASKPAEGWLWSIYSMVTGDKVAEMHMPAPAAQFFIRNGSFFYIEAATVVRADGQLKIERPRELSAMDLKTGRRLWSRPIRETAYLGPYPASHPNASAGGGKRP
jgi:hypothetical protein